MDAKANVTKQFLEDNNYVTKQFLEDNNYSKTQSDEKYSQRITYSTEEVDTGNKWIDGKTIYKKVIEYGNDSSAISSGTLINIGVNIDMLVSTVGYFKMMSDIKLNAPVFYNDGGFVSIHFNKPSMLDFQYAGYQIKKIFLILEYTKTS